MTLNQLLYFQTIAKLKHYRNAAIKLNVSQPSLSRSMRTLENELGILLFQKNGRNVELTKYGYLFLNHVDKILEEVSVTEHKMKQLSGNAGHIDIAYIFPLANYYIPHTVRSFLNQAENTSITFSFHQSGTEEMIAGLKSNAYDIVFGSFVENQPEIHFTPILNHRMVIITSVNHPLADRKDVDFSELANYPLIGYETASGLWQYLHTLFHQHGISPNIVCDCPDENAIAALVSEDFGIALVADVDAIQNANVTVLPLKGPPIMHTIYMAYIKEKYQIPAVKRFLRFIQQGTQ